MGRLKREYELKKEIGKGGFGTVYLATHLSDNKDVAIKKIDRTKASSLNVRKEIDALKNLRHPNIVRFYDEFLDNGAQYIVMEYCRFGSLRDYILQKGKMTDECGAYVLRKLVKAVMYIHSNNMMHRDLSAQNILIYYIRSDGIPEVKITDFGLSTVLREGGQNTIAGTPGYMDRNVLGRHYTKEADVFALGGILYLMLTKFEPPRSVNSSLILDEVSEQGRELILKMRREDEFERISLKEVLVSSFMRAYGPSVCSRSPTRSSYDSTRPFSSERKPLNVPRRARSRLAQQRKHSTNAVTRDSAFESGSDFESAKIVGEATKCNERSRGRSLDRLEHKYCRSGSNNEDQENMRKKIAKGGSMHQLCCTAERNRFSSLSRNLQSASRLSVSNLIWPLTGLQLITSHRIVKLSGRFLFEKDGPVIYEVAGAKNIVRIVIVVEVWEKELRQKLKVFEPERHSVVPSENDPPLRLTARARMVFDSLEELCNMNSKRAQTILLLYKKILIVYDSIVRHIEKVVLSVPTVFTARVMGNGDVHLKFDNGLLAVQKRSNTEITVIDSNNKPSALPEEHLQVFKTVSSDLLKYERLVETKDYKFIYTSPFCFVNASCPPEDQILGCRDNLRSKEGVSEIPFKLSSKVPASKVSRKLNSDVNLSTISSENKSASPNPMLLPRESYDLRKIPNMQGVSCIAINGSIPKQKLRISTRRRNEFIYEEGDKERRFYFDVSKRDFSLLPKPLVNLMYTLLYEMDTHPK